jgi:tetratricopeptide (TPR) repeat protein
MKTLFQALAVATSLALLAVPALAADKKDKDKERPSGIAATVLDAAGKPLRDAAVVVKDPAGTVVFQGVTDKKGEFKVKIPGGVGKFVVNITAPSVTPFEGAIELTAGQESNVEVKMLSLAEGQKNEAIKAYNDAANAFREQNWETAKAKFNEAISLDPELAEPHLGLADIYLTENKTAEAVASIETFMKMRPEDEQGKRLAYTAYLRANEVEKAKKLSAELGDERLNKGLAIDTYNQGATASQKGDYVTAMAKFDEAAKLDPTLAEVHAGMASVYYNQAKFEQALAAAEKALSMKPGLTGGLRSRFLALDGLGKAEAGAAWEAYRAVDTKGALDLMVRRAETDFKDGNMAAAQTALNRVLSIDPDNAYAHLQIGLAYSGTEPAKAKVHLEKFLKLAPNHPEAQTAKDILAYLK